MPALSFGLKANKPPSDPPKPPQKRKAAFEPQDEEEDEDEGAFGALQNRLKKTSAVKASQPEGLDRPLKSPKLSAQIPSSSNSGAAKYTNLSALRSAKLQDEEASKLDATVYDYDEVYETFNAADEQKKKKEAGQAGEASVPKYMTSLLASAEVRKRDQLRAREKLLQKERDEEGDEFVDKEKFVTGAYKKQQEEMRQMEEEEKKREEQEEERKRKGGGMTAFHKDMLKKDEERQRAVEQAIEDAKTRKEKGEDEVQAEAQGAATEKDDLKMAAELNEKGAHVVINDEGEVVDKRQLLTAGLNVAPKKSGSDIPQRKNDGARPQEWQRSSKQQDARTAQRERQTRMMERQIEEMTQRQEQAEAEEEKQRGEKNKSKVTESDKLGARERYLQRKKEREEEAKKAKAGDG